MVFQKNKTESAKELTFPGDKSIAHRLVLISLILNKKILIKNLPQGQDVLTSLSIIKQLGCKVTNENQDFIIDGTHIPTYPAPITLNCRNSGTTARLLCGILANLKGNFKLIGDESLSKRPMNRVTKPLSEMMGIDITSTNGHLPVFISATETSKSIKFNNITGSAQVKSAILFAGIAANGITEVIEKIPSRDHTERLLKYINTLPKGNCLEFNIPGDISSAAYFIVDAIINRQNIIIKNILLNPTRIGFIRVLKRMGAKISETVLSDQWEPVGNIEINPCNLAATNIMPEEIPSLIDELPILAVAMCFARGKSTVTGAEELRVKESDRISCLISQLKAVGVECSEQQDGYTISGYTNFKDAELDSFGDHRLAMSFAILAKNADSKISLKNSDSVAISFPDFFQKLSSTALTAHA